jgi:hypothetical protein
MANVSDTTVLAIPGIGAISFDAISLTGATLEQIEASEMLAMRSHLDALPVAIEAALLNEGDGQQLIDAIVMAIGNENITADVIATAVAAHPEIASRLDLEVINRNLKKAGLGIPPTENLNTA